RLKNWKMKPMWSRRSSVSAVSSRAVTSTPASDTSPEVGLSRPARMCMSVDRRVALAITAHDRRAPHDGGAMTVGLGFGYYVRELVDIHDAVLRSSGP